MAPTSPFSEEIIYTPSGGSATPLRAAFVSRVDEVTLGGQRARTDSVDVEISRADLATVTRDDTFVRNSLTYRINNIDQDVDGLYWLLGAVS